MGVGGCAIKAAGELTVDASARARPSAYERAVDAWLFSTMSWADSVRFG